MAKDILYSEEFKQEAINQVFHHNYPEAEFAEVAWHLIKNILQLGKTPFSTT